MAKVKGWMKIMTYMGKHPIEESTCSTQYDFSKGFKIVLTKNVLPPFGDGDERYMEIAFDEYDLRRLKEALSGSQEQENGVAPKPEGK